MNKADKFIARKSINTKYKPLYHLSAPYGWINDPNGFCVYKGEWHLFYQYNPYSSHWGRMHWGHAKSKDLCNWEHLPVALSPDTPLDNFMGCFSGSAIEKDGKLYLMYTGVPLFKQHQLLASSIDGIYFEKYSKPVIPIGNRPPKCGRNSFRDPKIFVKDDTFYCVIGASLGKGRQIALYKSDDLIGWQFVGSLKKQSISKGIYECPDLVMTKSGDIIIYSIMYTETHLLEYQNLHSSVYEIGKVDLKDGSFLPTSDTGEFDKGADFYAPQTTTAPDNRTILVAWMQMWWNSIPTAYLGHGFAGMFTLPREIEIKDNKLYQKPAREVYSLFEKGTSLNEVIDKAKEFEKVCGEVFFLKLKIKYSDNLVVTLRKSENCQTLITFDNGLITFNREKSGHPIKGAKLSGNCNVRQMLCDTSEFIEAEIFSDKSSIEIFVNNRHCMSNTIYPFDESYGITFSSQNGAKIDLEFFNYIQKQS